MITVIGVLGCLAFWYLIPSVFCCICEILRVMWHRFRGKEAEQKLSKLLWTGSVKALAAWLLLWLCNKHYNINDDPVVQRMTDNAAHNNVQLQNMSYAFATMMFFGLLIVLAVTHFRRKRTIK